jgi:hypothetical protein
MLLALIIRGFTVDNQLRNCCTSEADGQEAMTIVDAGAKTFILLNWRTVYPCQHLRCKNFTSGTD